MESPDEDDLFNRSMPDEPFNFTMHIVNKLYFAKADTMLDQCIAHFQFIQPNEIQDARPG